ncbi:cation/hydrogen exchanger family protein [Artemisia annua]|uniref:Cation/hydrogen exchanger family protein n=1 Tax=Artemisia annua TaxID=35608 RepID=A0A2U1NDD2_ARTAN|nr:cation/hydrogen exchanger family protein [Artemisia annua]
MILRDIAEKYSMFIKGKGGGRADSTLTTGTTDWEKCPELDWEKKGYTGKFFDNKAQTAMILRDIAEKYSMFIKGKGGGRADSTLTTGTTDWEECPELGIVYINFLSYS